jgi:ABC-type nitrate/sulfonate/bicarbonate transport system permease component
LDHGIVHLFIVVIGLGIGFVIGTVVAIYMGLL